MKKTIFSVIGLLSITFSGLSQTNDFDPTNAREGETVEYCQTHKKMAALRNTPEYQAYLAEQAVKGHDTPVDVPKGTVYTIPVVFHVLHNNGTENISDEQILDALDILNRDYRLLNSDAANCVADFISLQQDAEIEFVLATKAPNGTCFTGITRTVSTMTYDGSDGDAQVNAIKAGNNVYQGEWAGNKYLNIFICEDIGGAAGYTFNPYPGWTSMNTGIWILHNYVGSIGTSDVGTSRALTHEVGHWLNLDHTWGPNNNPGNASSCNDDDAVSDTPDCIGLTSCNLNANSCSNDNAYWGFDIKDNAENYMDYSYCSKMFTAGQVTRMRNALNSSSGGRNNVVSTTNLTNVGGDGNLYLCKADFSADRTTICAGDQIQFTDESYNAVNGWTWTLTGGTPPNSNSQNPTVVYSNPGIYTVVLAATDGSTNDSETKTSYIRVLPASSSIPFLEGFEDLTTLTNIEEWEIYDSGNNVKFEITSSTSHSGAKCAKLANFGQSVGNIDELISRPIDLSVIPGSGSVTLSFRYAYARKTTGNDEYLKVFITNDCGSSWAQRKTLHGGLLSDDVSSSNWTPTAADWITVHMTNITNTYFVDNFRAKFSFESDGGNNFYLDNINLYSGAPSEELVAEIDAIDANVNDVTLYPNPVDNELNVSFSLTDANQTTVTIQDVSGKIIQSHNINGAAGSNLVMMDTNELATGMYFLNIIVAGQQRSVQFVVK